MDKLEELSDQISTNQERLNHKIQQVFIGIEKSMAQADIKEINVGKFGEKLVLKEAGDNNQVRLCYLLSEPEKNSNYGVSDYYVLTPTLKPIYPFPSPSRYAEFGWILTSEDFQKELVNLFSSCNTNLQKLEERIETSYWNWLS